jgi:hypothetical protein
MVGQEDGVEWWNLEFFVAPKKGLKNLAQCFNPGNHQVRRFALKGARDHRTFDGLTSALNASDLEPFHGSPQERYSDTVPRVETLGSNPGLNGAKISLFWIFLRSEAPG